MSDLIATLVDRSGDLKCEVLEFARKPRFDRVFRQEIRARFGRIVVADEEELSNFFDWFIQEFRLHDGRTVVDCFVEAHIGLLPAERDFLLGWRHIREGIFEVVGRDGASLLAENVIDDLPYRIRANVGPSIFDRMPPGSFLCARVVPVGVEWLMSGASTLFGADQRDDVLAAAARTATERPDLVFHNPQRLARGWELQRAQYAAFVQHFGTDEITANADDVAELMRGFWTQFAGSATTSPTELSWLDDTAETVGIIYDETAGLGMYADYGLAQEAFANPDLMRRRRHKETIKAYLTDDTVDPIPLQRLAARHPGNASRVIRLALGKPGFSWESDGDQLLRQRKKTWYEQSALPRLTVLSDRLAGYLRGR